MVEVLEGCLLNPSQHELPVVKTLVVALGDMGAREAVPVLIKVMQGYVGVRSLAAKALGKLGDVQAAEALVCRDAGSKSRSLQLCAMKSLRTGYRPAVPWSAPSLRSKTRDCVAQQP